MTSEELQKIWDNTPKDNIMHCSDFSKNSIDRILYKHPDSKLYMNPYKLIELSNISIYKLEKYLPQMIITEQLYNHLGIFTVDDKKYHTLGRVFDIVTVEGIGSILIINNDKVCAMAY